MPKCSVCGVEKEKGDDACRSPECLPVNDAPEAPVAGDVKPAQTRSASHKDWMEKHG